MRHKIVLIFFSFVFAVLVWGSITLSDQFYNFYELPVKVINTPKGYVCGITDPPVVTIKLKAKGWQLLNLGLNPTSEFLVSADDDSGKLSVNSYNQIPENAWLGKGISNIDILPKSISLIVEKIEYKKIKVEANTDVSFQQGYGLATPIKVYPDSIIVSGPKSVIEKTFLIKTQLVSFESLDSKKKIITTLKNIPGFKFQQNYVELTFDVQRIVDNTFDGIKVLVKNLPVDRDVVLIPNTISCTLRGGIDIIGKINANQIQAFVNYRDVVMDTIGALKPQIIIPPDTELLFTKPQDIRYFIKKFE